MPIVVAPRRRAPDRWVRLMLTMFIVQVVLGLLFLVETMLYSWLGSPDPPRDAIVACEITDLCVAADGDHGVALLLTQQGDVESPLRYLVVLYARQQPERATILHWKQAQPLRVAHSPVAHLAAVGCTDGRLYLLQTGNTAPNPRFLGQTRRRSIERLCFSPDGRWLVSLGDDELMRWSLVPGEPPQEFSLPQGPYRTVAWHPDGVHLVLGNTSGDIFLMNVLEQKARNHFANCGRQIFDLGCSPDGRRLVTVGVDGALHAWDLRTGRLLWQHDPTDWRATSEVAIAADSKTVLTGFLPHPQSGAVAVAQRDLETGRLLRSFHGHTNRLRMIGVAGNQTLHTGGLDGTIRTWDLQSAKALDCLSAPDLLQGTERSIHYVEEPATGHQALVRPATQTGRAHPPQTAWQSESRDRVW